MKEYKLLKIDRYENGVLLVTLDRPPLNLMSPDLLFEIKDFFNEVNSDDTLRAIMLTGSKRSFCAGADTTTFANMPKGCGGIIGQRCYNTIESCRLPVIAAIEGHCLGGGLELALCCDIRYASETASIGLVEANLGLTAAYGGNTRLPWFIGEANAKLMFYTAAKLSGEEAYRNGLVQGVFAPDQLIEKALELAQLMATKAPRSLTAVKRITNGFRHELFAHGFALETDLSPYATQSADAREGISAMREKRKPVFQNK